MRNRNGGNREGKTREKGKMRIYFLLTLNDIFYLLPFDLLPFDLLPSSA